MSAVCTLEKFGHWKNIEVYEKNYDKACDTSLISARIVIDIK
jgi:hypothetical protein